MAEINSIYDFVAVPVREFYYNPQGFYSINEICTKTELPESRYDKVTEMYYTTLVGRTMQLENGRDYKVKARLVENEKYGFQYEILNITTQLGEQAQTKLDNNYLKAIVTPAQYTTLTKEYPNIVQCVIDNPNFEPEYKKLKGIKAKTWEKIRDKILTNQTTGSILGLLTPLGVTNNMITKLMEYEPNPDILRKKLHDNPYEFTKISGFGFMTVDKLALKINQDLATSSFRVAACTKHILEEQALNGNLFISIQDFGKAFSKIIPPNSPNFQSCFSHVKELIQVERELTKDGKSTMLHVVNDMIGLQKYYNMESKIWENLKRIRDGENFKPNVPIEEAIEMTNLYFSTNGKTVELTDEQINAVKSTIDNKVVIITANAGCGKTVCIKGIINLYRGFRVVTAALSGKAARRIEETTQIPSNTIHRLLEWNPAADGFLRNEQNPLDIDIVILDECSMIDDRLLLHLLKAMPDNAKLVLVFDDAQLSPIGAGSPAKDLLKSNLYINRLTKIHRQAENSGIKIDANKIRQNTDIFTPLDGTVDENGERTLYDTVVHGVDEDMEITMFPDSKLCQEDIFRKAFNLYFELLGKDGNTVDDITIVVPKKDGINSTRNFNAQIQEKLLHDQPAKMVIRNFDGKVEKIFKKDARVIQRNVNDYERNIMNGEIGRIIDANQKFCTVSFDNGEKVVIIPEKNMRNMELAYAITVHSMQGSECKNIIVILDNSHFILLDCALFYTAVTRAQSKCYLLMQPSAYRNALLNNKTERRTYLPEIMANDKE